MSGIRKQRDRIGEDAIDRLDESEAAIKGNTCGGCMAEARRCMAPAAVRVPMIAAVGEVMAMPVVTMIMVALRHERCLGVDGQLTYITK
jgi:hypothetical protein